MLYTNEMQVPTCLHGMVTPGMASGIILSIVKTCISRLNTPALNTSVFEFNAVCGGPYRPCIRTMDVSAVENEKNKTVYFTIDLARSCMWNDALNAPGNKEELSKLYDKIKLVVIVDGDPRQMTGRQLEKYVLSRLYGKKERGLKDDC